MRGIFNTFSNMKHVYKVLNNIQTHLITWGNPFDCNGQDVIVCITGNPGIPEFYVEFGSQLYEMTALPICIIGQAGHEDVPEQDSNKLKGQEHLFNLAGQLQHKLDLISNHIDKNSHVHIIGHSIGAWMIVELLHHNNFLHEKILTTNLLFPTLQKMAETKNGQFLNNVVRRINSIILLLCAFLSLLPNIVTKILIAVYLKCNSLPLSYTDRILKVINPNALEKIFFLAYNEMDTVLKLNVKGIEKIKHPINIIYSTRDDWVPLQYMEDLKKLKTLNSSIEMKQVDIGHSFVLKSSEKIACMVSKYVKEKDK